MPAILSLSSLNRLVEDISAIFLKHKEKLQRTANKIMLDALLGDWQAHCGRGTKPLRARAVREQATGAAV